MHEEREFRSHPRPGNHALIPGYGQRRAALRDEDVWGRWGVAQELAQRAAFPRRYRMHAGIPALGPANMQAPGGELDVVPAQCHQLRGALRPWREATKIAVASRCPERFCLAASMSRSTSRSVRYSRLRLPTVTFTEAGAASRSRKFTTETALPPIRTVTDWMCLSLGPRSRPWADALRCAHLAARNVGPSARQRAAAIPLRPPARDTSSTPA